MKRGIAFLLIALLVIGLFAGCKSKGEDTVPEAYAENEQVIAGDEIGSNTVENEISQEQPQQEDSMQDAPSQGGSDALQSEAQGATSQSTSPQSGGQGQGFSSQGQSKPDNLAQNEGNSQGTSAQSQLKPNNLLQNEDKDQEATNQAGSQPNSGPQNNNQEQSAPSQGGSDQPQEDSAHNITEPQPPSVQEQLPDSDAEEEDEQPEQEELPLGEGGGPLFDGSENPYKDSLKILAFGNSFSKDAMQHLWDIAKSYGVKNVVLGNLNIGGCSLATHYENMTQNAAVYAYTKNSSGNWETSKNATAMDGLQDEDWDIITIQQASDQNADFSTYNTLSAILRYLEQHKPSKDTKLLWHMTWAYQADSKKKAFAEYGYDQTKMYDTILDRVRDEVLCFDNFAGVIPAGTAIQNLRKTSVGDMLTRDGYHMSYGMGRYVVALTWYCYITGADPFEAKFVPSEDQAEIYLHQDEINQAIADAIRNPYEITAQS